MGQKKAKPPAVSTVTGTVEDFISQGYEEIQEVGQELREAYDNAPDNLKGSDLNSRRDETASTIEGFSEPTVDSDVLGQLPCSAVISNGKWYRGRMTQSRSCRASNGAARLKAAADAINEWLESHEEIPSVSENDNDTSALEERLEKLKELEKEGIDPDDYEKARSEAEELASNCEEIANEAEGLDFPGMFG